MIRSQPKNNLMKNMRRDSLGIVKDLEVNRISGKVTNKIGKLMKKTKSIGSTFFSLTAILHKITKKIENIAHKFIAMIALERLVSSLA